MSWDSMHKPVYKQYTIDKLPPHIPMYKVSDMHIDKQGELWVGAVGLGLVRLNPVSGNMKTYKHK